MASNEVAPQVFGLFPTPLRRIERLFDPDFIGELVDHFTATAQQPNALSDQLMHSELATAEGDPLLERASRLIVPQLVDFGALLLGERLEWSIKEMWVNVLEQGGRQSVHNHANSFVSGVIYLTKSHPSANTVFVKAAGGSDFVLNNTNARAKLGPYNAGKWVSPDPSPGDMLLFPSYLLHEVPTNQGERRISLAFNAIPNRLDSWGYTLRLG